jgi:hypothetical protein
VDDLRFSLRKGRQVDLFLRAALLFGLVLLSGCARHTQFISHVEQTPPSPSPASTEPVDLTGVSAAELQKHVGKQVTARGKFSLDGLPGPFIRYGDQAIYIYRKPVGEFSYGREYSRTEGHEVRLTGILRFQHFEPSPEQHPPDYFYFEGETVRINLVK